MLSEYRNARESLIKELKDCGCLKSKEAVSAFKKVPRERFVLPEYRKYAYANEPLPIEEGQTISQPLTVAVMTEALHPKKGDNILEIGSGSGYQAAILSEIVGCRGRIITIERIKALFDFASSNLKDYKNVTVIHGNGSKGYEKYAPYDGIIVTASAANIPETLITQLKPYGRMVIPVGNEMFLIEKRGGKIEKTFLGYYAFVPLVEG